MKNVGKINLKYKGGRVKDEQYNSKQSKQTE